MNAATVVLTSVAGGLLIGVLAAAAAALAASPVFAVLAFARGPQAALSALKGLLALVGWPTAAFAGLQLTHLLAVAATSRLARRWVAALTLCGAGAGVSLSGRPVWAGSVAVATLAAAALSWRLESGLGPLAPSLKVPPGPGV